MFIAFCLCICHFPWYTHFSEASIFLRFPKKHPLSTSIPKTTLPSGKHTKNDGKSQFSSWVNQLSIAIFKFAKCKRLPGRVHRFPAIFEEQMPIAANHRPMNEGMLERPLQVVQLRHLKTFVLTCFTEINQHRDLVKTPHCQEKNHQNSS